MLSTADYHTLLAAIARLHAAEDPAALPALFAAQVRQLVPGEHVCYNDVQPRTNQATSVFDEPSADRAAAHYVPIFARHMHQNPLVVDSHRHRRTHIRKISDFVPDRLFRERPLYRECYRHLDTDYQMSMPVLVEDDRIVAITANRRRHDFTERDRAMLQRLQPHAMLAFRRMQSRARTLAVFGASQPAAEEQLRTLGLTERQASVLYWVLQGKTNVEIALLLAARPRTIDKHPEHIRRRLHVDNRAACIVTVLRHFAPLP